MPKSVKYFILLSAIGCVQLMAFSQGSIEPEILRKVVFEKKRDTRLEAAIIRSTGVNEVDDKSTRYYYNFVDLNGDRKSEVLVYIFGGYFCGTGGCDAYLFREAKQGYKLVTHFEPVRNPIIVSQNKTKGWNDLIFFNRGGGIIPGYYSICRFNGKSYCENPTIKDEVPSLTKRVKGVAYLIGNGHGESGLRFLF